MTLHLARRPSFKGATLGSLAINGVWFCWTLEDEIREVKGQPVAAWKVPGETAIPAGLYRVTLTQSSRFNRIMPLLNDVPGFSGVRIHAGNTAESTHGCLLLGYDKYENSVGRSRAAFEELLTRLQKADLNCERIEILVENPHERQSHVA